jgi:hypothetical protein
MAVLVLALLLIAGYVAFWAWLVLTAQEGEDRAPAEQQKAPPDRPTRAEFNSS